MNTAHNKVFTQCVKGMTLIELMVVVAVVAIIAAIAYPSYRSQMLRANRAEARNALLQIQVAQEKYFLQNNNYGTLVQLGYQSSTPNTANNYYQLSQIPATPTTTFTATATAIGPQASDSACAVLTVNQVGTKTPSPPSSCWK